ncbi:S-adenosyl-L-methionine-dependent methyltransferase [Epithele typhae]|uniref:S-adenosyl-L-methionine-dependent methyltransferase n=1 Tax=Epithele typhae TaxID=378194 RepID=UPI0020085142|nr:S-adenosyl-L-methionine-dependent methyltransferase [Epithele typhae]KAH9943288.1 S-adenosyl-L-methionine-dependent methyltransferase [Epithele typhae]
MPAPAPPHKASVLHIVLTRLAAISVLLGLSLVTWTYRRALEPQYGSAPTNLHLSKVVWSSAILGSFAPAVPLSRATLGLGLLLYAFPTATYWSAAYTARLGDALWGPVATHLIVLLPVLSLGTALVKALQEAPYVKNDPNAPQSAITLPVSATAVNALQGLWPAVPYIVNLPNGQVALQLGTLVVTLWAIAPFLPSISPPPAKAQAPATPTPEPSKGKKKKGATEKSTPLRQSSPPKPQNDGRFDRIRMALIPVLPFLTSTLLQPPTLPHPLLQPYDHPSYPLRIHSAVDSAYSSIVVVGETIAEGMDALNGINNMRFLRAGHSLLGGVWVGPKAITFNEDPLPEDESGQKLGDTIYSAFVLQEAALLAKDKPQDALIIGLGTGVTASSFMRHGISTTIIEIDPTVYDAARKFFGLPASEPGQVFIEDARGWVHNRSETNVANPSDVTEQTQYDLVVHDCFSGGGIPAHLYTEEFWKELKGIVRPDAVIAVNFAGVLESDSAKALILTLKTSFPQCRAFYDAIETPTNITTEFQNWVFFCTPSSEPLTFRAARESDIFGSHLRRHVFTGLPNRESDISVVGDDLPEDKRNRYILKDTQNPLGEWQAEGAMHHWEIMRQVLPDVIWETY